MRLAVFFIATMAYAQSEMGTSAIRIMPRAADSDTGSVRFYDLTGTYRTDVRAQASQVANKILRMPSENGIIVGTENHRYGSDTFTITGFKARGTEASPSNVSAGDVLFQFMGQARVGGSFTNAGSITFATDAVSPLDTSVNFGLTVGGSYGTRFSMDKASFYGVGRPDLGLSAAGGRWGTIYGDSLDLLVPTGTSPQYETGSFIRAQSLELYDSTGYSGGFKQQVVNATGGASYLEILDASAAPVWRYNRVASGSPVSIIDSYMSIVPATNTTYSLGSTSKRWDKVWADKIDLGTGGFTSNASPYVSGAVDLGSSLLEWNKLYVHDIELTGTCTGCPTGGSGSAPLNEVKVTDYGADDTCTTAITAGSPSPWSQAYDVAKLTGGYVTFPAGGCYGIAATLVNGNSAGTSESTERAIIFKGAGAAYNPSGLAPATEIRWIGSAPGSATPMVQFSGPINAGGIEGILLNANNVANVYFVNQRHHAYGSFRNVWAKRSPVSPSWIVTTSSNTYPYGSCYNRYDQLHITNDGVSGAGGMYLTGSTGSGRDACSNLFTDGEIWYDSDTAGTYGVKLDYADNNTFLRFNLFRTSSGPGALESAYNSGSAWAVSCNTSTDYCTLGASNSAIVNGSRVRFSYTGSLPTGIAWAFPYFVINKSGNSFQVSTTSGGSAVDITTTGSNVIVFLINPGVLLERYSGDTSFPKENAWYSSAIHNGVWSPNPPTGGNDFPEFQPDDCYVSPCIPDLDYVWGKAKGQMLGSGNTPPGVEVRHSDSQNTFRINQASGLNNGAGSIAFQRNGTTLGRIRSNYFDGLVFSTSNGGGTLTERWRITSGGHLFPSADATYTIGDSSNRAYGIYSQTYQATTSNAFGPANNTWVADNNLNLNLKAYGSAGNDYRAGLNFYRSQGTVAAPSAVAANDRLGVIAFWYNTASLVESMSVGGRIQVVVDGTSGGVDTSMRFHTADNSIENLQWKIDSAGDFLPGSSVRTIGNPSNPVGNVYAAAMQITGGGTIFTSSHGAGSIGTSGQNFNSAYVDNYYGRTAITIQNTGNARFVASPTSISLIDSSNNAVFGANSSAIYMGPTTFGGSITAPNGSLGSNGTAACGSGQAVKSITVSYGLVTSVSCGAP